MTEEYDRTEYLESVKQSKQKDVSLHSCPECNPSEHVKMKKGLYACAFCGRIWKNHFRRMKNNGG